MSIKPKHHLGQNFLQDEEVLQKIIDAADLKKTDVVLEVGPGTGVLTKELVKRAGKVIAVEKDERLARTISNAVRDRSSKPEEGLLAPLEVVEGDILRFHLDKYIQGPYKVVANIPYYLTSKLFQYFLQQGNQPKLLVLMVQKEVGERVVAKPGELSVLGISVQFYADAELVKRGSDEPSPRQGLGQEVGDLTLDPCSTQENLGGDSFGNEQKPFIIPKTSFWPQPEVDSVILKIIPRDKYADIKDQKKFFSIIKSAFVGKRKQLKNTIKNIEALKKAGIDPRARPQDLSIEQWLDLYKNL